jgi:cytochrome b
MRETKVFDWPTRLFHGLFAAVFVMAFLITKTIDDESPAFAYHMLLGLLLAGIVGLRVIWGLIGSRYARFSSFALNPFDLIPYFKRLLGKQPDAELGHNPASSWAALVMMALALGLAFTGYAMTNGGGNETLEDIHELLANAFAITAILHVAGVFFHAHKHGDAIGMSMVDGKKVAVADRVGIENNHPVLGLVFLILVGASGFYLYNRYDKPTQVLNLFGKSLQLGEAENEGEGKDHGDQKAGADEDEKEEDDDGDDD